MLQLQVVVVVVVLLPLTEDEYKKRMLWEYSCERNRSTITYVHKMLFLYIILYCTIIITQSPPVLKCLSIGFTLLRVELLLMLPQCNAGI